MPEGSYRATVTIERDSWTRARWFARRIERAHVDIHDPIPTPGKGENSWDCGDDALHSSTFPCGTVPAAVGKIVGDVLAKRGHSTWTWPRKKEVA